MNILLYLNDNIMTFKLPIEVSGSYSFHALENEVKLINIDSEDDGWYLHKTSDVKILNGDSYVDKIILQDDTFYILENDNTKYLIYVEDKRFKKFLKYEHDFINPLVISNKEGSSIYYNCSVFKDLNVEISKRSDMYFVKKDDNIIYRNKKVLTSVETSISNGDEIEIYGLRITVVNNQVFINNNSRIAVNLKSCQLPDLKDFKVMDIKEIPLYKKDDYYNKAPRIRRRIEEMVLKIDKPPTFNQNQELPVLLTIGPMITMGATSSLTLLNILIQLSSEQTTFARCWPQLFTCIAMIASMFLWPSLIKHYNKKMAEENEYKASLKFAKYFDLKRAELNQISANQSVILNENLVTVDDCLKAIEQKQIGFWDKRVDQDDFLVVRFGMGRQKLRCHIEYPEEGFTMDESDLKKRTDDLVEDFRYIDNVPVSYSFKDHKLTAIMGSRNLQVNFLNNILLQLITFYNYDDLKIVVITKEENVNDFLYIKYLNHNFSNDKQIRYFAYDSESIKTVCNYLSNEVNYRNNVDNRVPFEPHYFVIVDDYESVIHYDLFDTITESEKDLGFSLVFLENRMSNLPSKCDNFITLSEKKSDVLVNAFEEHEQESFINEIHYNLDMMKIAKSLANVPIKIKDDQASLPETITFLEMEKIGKVDQLNVLNRWLTNDSTRSLRAEIGVDSLGSLMYLDLHEKFHGPHGLIAGMTGSGKSEFIITYILSMCINYSPNEVSFILIDYKGGGLAGAFENETTGIRLPHLAGTITNLDKAEMDRTLVSINSELERRQKLFNEARDTLGESTMDIYKYQSLFRDGKLTNAIPHLFIICDEFAELKAQQPDFMDSLISTARIGRSLGVHLILATQKPSGVVNDQIWSNTKFRVCLKVQDASDSKEMLKKSDAASLKQTGRFYLQVGYDEYYALGQSAWCGAKYYPNEMYTRKIDKSINFIDSLGYRIKNISESTSKKSLAQGEQITSILKHIMDVAKKENLVSRRLWLENIPEFILEGPTETKYSFAPDSNNIEAVIGEYDAPELQKQGIVTYNYLNDANTIIYGLDGSENELFLNALMFSTVKNFSSELINFYIVDFGSESLRKFGRLPHVGGIVLNGEDDKFTNLLKLLSEELSRRKKILADYDGNYKKYRSIKNDLPIITVILNNYDSIYDSRQSLYEELPELIRDSERYGIVFIVTCGATNSMSSRITQNFNTIFAFKLKDKSDYSLLFNVRASNSPRDLIGRGLLKQGNVLHEFQVAHICNEDETNDVMDQLVEDRLKVDYVFAKKIPVLPDIVRQEDVKMPNISLDKLPIGIAKDSLDVVCHDLTSSVGNIITSNRIGSTNNFIKSLLSEIKSINNSVLIVLDPLKELDLDRNDYKYYYTENIKKSISMVSNFVDSLIEKQSNTKGVVVIHGLQKFVDLLDDTKLLEDLVQKLKKYEHIHLIVSDDALKVKKYIYEQWFKDTFNTNNGIWIGRGIGDQSLLHVSTLKREMLRDIKDDMGYVLTDGSSSLVKFIDFITEGDNTQE